MLMYHVMFPTFGYSALWACVCLWVPMGPKTANIKLNSTQGNVEVNDSINHPKERLALMHQFACKLPCKGAV